MGTPRTHRRFLNRSDGSYGPIPSRRPLGMLSMPFNRTAIQGLYCVGDSTFPGQGVNAGAWVCEGGDVGSQRVCVPSAADLRLYHPSQHPLPLPPTGPLPPLPPPAVVFSGFGCAHRVLCDLDMEPRLPAGLDDGYNVLLGAVRDRA